MHVARILAVDCGASHVACGRFSGHPGRLALEHFDSRLLPASDLNEADWVSAVGAALQELQRAGRLRGECVLGLPGHLTFNRLLHVPRVTDRQSRKIVEFERRQGMPAAEEMVWSDAPVSNAEDGRELILAAAKRRVIEQLGSELRRSGLYPYAVLPALLVLRSAIRSRPPTPGDSLVLSVGARSSHLVFCGPGRFFARTIAIGGNLVTQKLGEELDLDSPSAERLKLRGLGGGAEPGDGQRACKASQIALDQFVRRLCAEIQGSPPLALAGSDPFRPKALFLTGGGALLRGLPGALAERLQLQVERWDLRKRNESGRASADPDGRPEDGPPADLIGLAAWAATGSRTEGNLLPRRYRHGLSIRRRWPWLAGAALLGIIGGQQRVWRWQTKASEVRRRIAEVDAGISVLRQTDARNRSNLARLAEAGRQICALRKLASARSGWIALLGDLHARLASVQDAWIDRLQILPPEDRYRSPLARDFGTEPRPAPAARAAASDTVRLQIEGSVFDAARPLESAGEGSEQNATALLAALRGSPLVCAVEREHFDGSQPGLLRFEITLRLSPHALN